jgi:competence protein ComEC
MNTFFATLPIAKLTVPSPSIFTFIVYYLLVWLLLSPMTQKRKTVIFSVMIIGNIFAWKGPLFSDSHLLKLTLLDVGKGNSTLIQLPNSQTFLINSGEKWGNFDSGEYVVIPFLNKFGITEIDKFILTDNDSANINSAKSVAEEVKIEEVLMANFDVTAQKIDQGFVENISNGLISLDSIDEIADDQNRLRISFFDYPNTKISGSISDVKIIKISYKDVDFCLLDGIKRVEFDSSFTWNRLRDCEVLVISELGDYEDTRGIVERIKPQKIIFTRYYFRYQKDKIPTLMALEFPQIEYHRTLRNGAIICKTDGEKIDFDFTIADE